MLKLFMKSNIRLFVCHDTPIQWVWLKLLIHNRTCLKKMPPLISIQPIYVYNNNNQRPARHKFSSSNIYLGKVIINNGNYTL